MPESQQIIVRLLFGTLQELLEAVDLTGPMAGLHGL